MGLVIFLGICMVCFVRGWGFVVVYIKIFWAFRNVVNARDCSFDLLGHHVTSYLYMPSSMCIQSKYCLNSLSWGSMCFVYKDG